MKNMILRMLNRKRVKEETKEILSNAGIPEWYIQSCEKIEYLTSRMDAITRLKHFGTHVGKGK